MPTGSPHPPWGSDQSSPQWAPGTNVWPDSRGELRSSLESLPMPISGNVAELTSGLPKIDPTSGAGATWNLSPTPTLTPTLGYHRGLAAPWWLYSDSAGLQRAHRLWPGPLGGTARPEQTRPTQIPRPCPGPQPQRTQEAQKIPQATTCLYHEAVGERGATYSQVEKTKRVGVAPATSPEHLTLVLTLVTLMAAPRANLVTSIHTRGDGGSEKLGN